MTDPSRAAADQLATVARDVLAQAVGQGEEQVAAIVRLAEDQVAAAERQSRRALALPAEALDQLRQLADGRDPLGMVLWALVALADALAPSGVSVTAYDPAPETGRPRSVAVTYQRDEVTAALAFTTSWLPGGGFVLAAHGNGGGPVDLVTGGWHVRLEGLADSHLTIPFAAGVQADAHGAVTALVERTETPSTAIGGVGDARLGRPALTVHLAPSADGFSYRAELGLVGNALRLDLTAALGALAEVVSLPSLDEQVDLVLRLEGGALTLAQVDR